MLINVGSQNCWSQQQKVCMCVCFCVRLRGWVGGGTWRVMGNLIYLFIYFFILYSENGWPSIKHQYLYMMWLFIDWFTSVVWVDLLIYKISSVFHFTCVLIYCLVVLVLKKKKRVKWKTSDNAFFYVFYQLLRKTPNGNMWK